MKRILLWSHVAFVLAGYALFGLSFLILPPGTPSMPDRNAWFFAIVAALAGLGSLTGFWSMALRSGKSESIALGVSTIAAVLLLVLGVFSL